MIDKCFSFYKLEQHILSKCHYECESIYFAVIAYFVPSQCFSAFEAYKYAGELMD